jgi:hypothetical protein
LSISSYVSVWSKEQYSLHAIQERHPPHLAIFIWFELSYTILHRATRNCFTHMLVTRKVNTCKTEWFFMTPSIATKFQYINSLLFPFLLTTRFGPYGPSSSETLASPT